MTHLTFKQSELPGEWASEQFAAFCDRLINLATELKASKIISPMLSTAISMDDRFQRTPEGKIVHELMADAIAGMTEDQKMALLQVMLEESKALPEGNYPAKLFGTLAGFLVYLDPMLGEDAPATLHRDGVVVGSIGLTDISFI